MDRRAPAQTACTAYRRTRILITMRSFGTGLIKRSVLTAAITAAIAFSVTGCKKKAPEPTPAATTTTPPKKVKPPVVTAPPAVKAHLYDDDADPNKLIAAGLKQARKEHKRVILDFGGDWCGDCQVLDIYLHQPPNLDLFEKNFLLVHVDIGHFDKNIDVTEEYGIPLKKGVPALAVLGADGKVLYSQQTAEFGDMRYMQSTSVTDFLNRWKA